MSRIQAKQIKKILTGSIKITGVSVLSTNSSVVVTTPITSALTIAGDGGTAVPLVASAAVTDAGVIVASPMNRADVWNNVSKDKLLTTTNREVYGRITVSSGIYTLTFYYLNTSGVETGYTFTANTTIDFDFNYRFEFEQAPADIIVSQLTRNVAQDAALGGVTNRYEILTVTATNTISALSTTTSDATKVKLFVNGKLEDPLGGSPSFSISSGVNVTWSSSNAGYSVETTDRVIAEYPI